MSYSGADGFDSAEKIFNTISSEKPTIKLWWDKKENRLQHANNWSIELKKGINESDGLIYLMTRDSLKEKSICLNEVQHARKSKKPIILLKADYDIEKDMDLQDNLRQFIDLSNGFNEGLKKLIERLEFLNSPDGKLFQMEDRMAYLEKELERAIPGEIMHERVSDDIARLAKEISEQKRIVENPEASKQEAAETIKENIKKDREKKVRQTPIQSDQSVAIVNAPPMVPPTYFQARKAELEEINSFLDNATHRVLMIAGAPGMGKTTLACKALSDTKALEKSKVIGVIYLSHNGSNKINTNNVLNGLKQFVPNAVIDVLNELLKAPNLSVSQKLMEVLKHFADKKVVLLFDNFETLLEEEGSEIKDEDIAEILSALIEAPHHGVKTIITTKKIPFSILRQQPGRLKTIQLQEGLDQAHSADLLRTMDASGKLGLKEASDELLASAFLQTKGNPRALETIYAILSADINASLESILESTKRATDTAATDDEEEQETTAEILADEAFNRLDKDSQHIMQAMAIYDAPVPASAINYMLLPFNNGTDSTRTLEHLKSTQFIHEENDAYAINSEYAEYAMSRMEEGDPITVEALDNPPFTVKALCLIAAEYWKLVRLDEEEWIAPEGLYAQIQEISARTRAGDFFGAAEVIDLIYLYLIQSGDYVSIINLATPLVDNLNGMPDPMLETEIYSHLGTAYKETNRYHDAIIYFEKAMLLAEKEVFHFLPNYLEAKGDCLVDLGKTEEALQLYLEALAIDEEIVKTLDSNMYFPMRMGHRFSKVGNTLIKIGADISDCTDYYSKASKQATISEDMVGHVYALLGFAQVMVVLNDFKKAVDAYNDVLEISTEMTQVDIKNEVFYRAGLVYLYDNDPQRALEFFNSAFDYVYPPNADNLHAARGIAALLLGDTGFAKIEFDNTLEVVDMQLNFSDDNYDGLFSKGHALVGLAMMQEDNTALLEQAFNCYKRAIQINNDYGVFGLEANLFGTLYPLDKQNQLDVFAERLQNEFKKIHNESTSTDSAAQENKDPLQLRNTYVENLLDDEVQQLLEHYNFFEQDRFASGAGLSSPLLINDTDDLIKDPLTGLMWEQAGSEGMQNFEKSIAYIDQLNATNHLGYNDWRLPTLEEALSLMTPTKMNKRYIDPVFSKKIEYIWTGDFGKPGRAWQVYYTFGTCAPHKVKGFWHEAFVKAVRED